MMAANYRHIGGLENRLGRHYSRFSATGPAAPLAVQSLARRKSRNGGSNRRSWVRCVCYIIPRIPCIFPASREFGFRDEFAQDCLLQRGVICEPDFRAAPSRGLRTAA